MLLCGSALGYLQVNTGNYAQGLIIFNNLLEVVSMSPFHRSFWCLSLTACGDVLSRIQGSWPPTWDGAPPTPCRSVCPSRCTAHTVQVTGARVRVWWAACMPGRRTVSELDGWPAGAPPSR